jgi:hypothetical protein
MLSSKRLAPLLVVVAGACGNAGCGTSDEMVETVEDSQLAAPLTPAADAFLLSLPVGPIPFRKATGLPAVTRDPVRGVVQRRSEGVTLTLVRAADGNTALVKQWLDELSVSNLPQHLVLQVLDGAGVPILAYRCIGCVPTKWSVTSFEADPGGVPIETLVLSGDDLTIVSPTVPAPP